MSPPSFDIRHSDFVTHPPSGGIMSPKISLRDRSWATKPNRPMLGRSLRNMRELRLMRVLLPARRAADNAPKRVASP
jgi:hypothetical protein